MKPLEQSITSRPLDRLSDIASLFKLRLALLVVFSAVLGYFLGADQIIFIDLMALSLGGLFLTGASNGLNQVWERDLDKLMERTQDRPIPAGRMSVNAALVYSIIAGISGILILWLALNPLCGILGLLALFSYVFIYTPMKRVSSLAVFVGAFPGAIPPMLGYVAASGAFGVEPGSLFAMQFMWQFPHFWAIAWVSHNDYARGGYRLLPFKEGKSKRSAFQIMLYTLFLIPVSLLPWALPAEAPLVGDLAGVVAVICGLLFAWYAYQLYKNCDDKSARKLMFASFVYLPVVQIVYVLDKI